jgi:hypothetical protein
MISACPRREEGPQGHRQWFVCATGLGGSFAACNMAMCAIVIYEIVIDPRQDGDRDPHLLTGSGCKESGDFCMYRYSWDES